MNAKTRLSGTQGIWTFVFIDMLIFSAIFFVFTSERVRLPDIYAQSQALLNGWLAFVNTLVLLTSSWAMVGAVEAWRQGDAKRSRLGLLLVLLLGLLFCILKIVEYWEKYEHGISLIENSFFSIYYFITGVHLLHVAGTLLFIIAIRRRMAAGGDAVPSVPTVENVGLFWHFVDTLWIYIFPLIYLVGLK